VLSEELDIEHVTLLNDLGAWGHSIEYLDPADFAVLNLAFPESGGTRALLAAGHRARTRLFLSGTGHATASALLKAATPISLRTPEQQIELLRFMRRRYPQVSWELILSGRGFRTLHEFLDPSIKTRYPLLIQTPIPLRKSRRMVLNKTCPVCVKRSISGPTSTARGGNFALKVLALGGVYVAAESPSIILEKMKDGAFFKSFMDKWHFENLLKKHFPSLSLLTKKRHRTRRGLRSTSPVQK